MDPLAGVVFGLIALSVLVVVTLQAVRFFRNNGDRTDVFGPPLDRETKPGDDHEPGDDTSGDDTSGTP
jgi:hypothetical protein